MKYFKYLFITICFIFLPSIVKADCSYERLAELSRIAGNVNFSYTYNLDEKNRPDFNVNIVNVTKDIYVYDSSRNQTITSFETDLTNLTSGQTLQFDIYSNDNNCRGEKIMSKFLTIPFYNHYSEISECKENPEFKYCQTWINTENLTYDQFLNKLNNYNNGNNNKNNNINGQKDLLTFISENLFLIILAIISIFILILLLWLKRSAKT